MELLKGWHKVSKAVVTDAAVSKDDVLYINRKMYEECQLPLRFEVWTWKQKKCWRITNYMVNV